MRGVPVSAADDGQPAAAYVVEQVERMQQGSGVAGLQYQTPRSAVRTVAQHHGSVGVAHLALHLRRGPVQPVALQVRLDITQHAAIAQNDAAELGRHVQRDLLLGSPALGTVASRSLVVLHQRAGVQAPPGHLKLPAPAGQRNS